MIGIRSAGLPAAPRALGGHLVLACRQSTVKEPALARWRGTTDGTPIEEAPFWVLAILAVLLWLICFPALVGLLGGFNQQVGRGTVALAAAAVAILVVAGVATRRPWRRRPPTDLVDERPLVVRFSTWLITALMLPNVLYGLLILTRDGPPPDYAAMIAIGMIVSAIHGLFAVVDRWRHRHPSS